MVSFDQAMQLRLFGPRLDPRLLSMPIDVTGRWNPGSDRTGSQVESGPDMGSTGVVRKMAKDWRQMPQTCPHRSVNSKPSRSVEAGNGVVIAKSIMEPAFLDEILTFAQRVKHVEEWGAAGPHGGEWDHQDSKSKKTKKQTSIRSARPRLSTLTSPMAAAGALQQQHLTSTLLNPSWEAPPRYQQSPFLGPLERKLERQMVRSAKKSYPGFDHLSRVRARPRTATPSCSGPHRSDRHAAAERDVSGFIEGMEESQRRSRPRTAVGFGGEQSAACASADMRANKDANRKEFRPSIGLRGGGLEQRDRKQRLERPHTATGMGPEAGRRHVSPPRAQSKPLAEDLESSPTWRPGTSNGISEDHDVQCRGSEGEVQRGHMHRDSKDATETIEAPWATQPASGGSWFIPERPFYFKDHHRYLHSICRAMA